MTQVSDNFVRVNSPSLGANWAVLSNVQSNPSASGASIQLLNNAFAPNSGAQVGFPTALGTWVGSNFGTNQYSTVKISAIASEQSVVAITAATQSGGNTTYNYTLSSGAALQNPQGIIVSGMAHTGNNGAFVISGLGAGTFTVANASGVTATESGTGTSATDSLCGPMVRGSSSTILNGYFIYIGNNSGYLALDNGTNDTRLYVREMWKFVNGTVSEIFQLGTFVAIPDSVGDVYHLFALGNKVALYKNQAIVLNGAQTDSSLTSGTPGIIVSSGQSAGLTTPVGATIGISGTQFTNFAAADFSSTPVGWTSQATETFWVASGTPPAPNPPYSQWTGFTSIPTFNSQGEITFLGTSSLIHTGRTWANDQASSVTISTTTGNTSQDAMVRCSQVAQTGYLAQFVFTNGLGAGTFHLFKFIAGTATELGGTGVAGSLNFGDVLRCEAVGTTINLKVNGSTIITVTDASIASGVPGMTGGGNALINFWAGDEVSIGGSGSWMQGFRNFVNKR